MPCIKEMRKTWVDERFMDDDMDSKKGAARGACWAALGGSSCVNRASAHYAAAKQRHLLLEEINSLR